MMLLIWTTLLLPMLLALRLSPSGSAPTHRAQSQQIGCLKFASHINTLYYQNDIANQVIGSTNYSTIQGLEQKNTQIRNQLESIVAILNASSIKVTNCQNFYSCPNLTQTLRVQLANSLNTLQQNNIQFKELQTPMDCTDCPQALTEMQKEADYVEQYVTLCKKTLNNQFCTKRISNQQATGLVDISNHKYKSNLTLGGWIYGNTTASQYKTDIVTKSVKYNLTTCPSSRPFVLGNQTCIRCRNGFFNLGKKQCIECEEGLYLNVATLECEICPANAQWNPDTLECHLCDSSKNQNYVRQYQKCMSCQADQLYNIQTQACDQVVCPPNYPLLNMKTLQCSACTTGNYIKAQNLCRECNQTELYNRTLKKCYTPTCNETSLFNISTKKCEPCPPHTILIDKTCVKRNLTSQCPPSSPLYDPSTHTCQPCPSKTVYNSSINKCQKLICPKMTMYDQKFQKCVTVCAGGTFWSQKEKKCVEAVRQPDVVQPSGTSTSGSTSRNTTGSTSGGTSNTTPSDKNKSQNNTSIDNTQSGDSNKDTTTNTSGSSLIGRCPPAHTYNSALRQCVEDKNTTNSGNSSSGNNSGDNSGDSNRDTNNTNSNKTNSNKTNGAIDNNSSDSGNNTTNSTSVDTDNNTNSINTTNPAETPEQNITCAQGYFFNETSHKCQHQKPKHIECQQNFYYNASTNSCVNTSTLCKYDQIFIVGQHKCQPKSQLCSIDQLYIESKGQCVSKDRACFSYQIYNQSTHQCQSIQSTCGEGEVYDPHTHVCTRNINNVQCQINQYYNTKEKTCMPQGLECKQDQYYNEALTQCRLVQKITSPYRSNLLVKGNFNSYVAFYNKQKKEDCPYHSPYWTSEGCISCPEDNPLFDLGGMRCTRCGDGEYFQISGHQCKVRREGDFPDNIGGIF